MADVWLPAVFDFAEQLFDELGLTKESFTHPNELKQASPRI